jgi:hypothetical protein
MKNTLKIDAHCPLDVSHFAYSVDIAVMKKLARLANAIMSGFDELVTGPQEQIIGPSLDVIHGRHVSGFIPFQDGGYSVSAFYRNDVDSTYHFTAAQTEFNNFQDDECYQSFILEHDLPQGSTCSEWNESTQSGYHKWENSYFEPALLTFDVYSKDGRIMLHSHINYKDAPYYRASYTETIKDIELSESKFLKMPYAALIEMMKA